MWIGLLWVAHGDFKFTSYVVKVRTYHMSKASRLGFFSDSELHTRINRRNDRSLPIIQRMCCLWAK